MATKAAHKRLTREYAALAAKPVPLISAHPSESNILEWHYILTGPPDTPYDGGQYWVSRTWYKSKLGTLLTITKGHASLSTRLSIRSTSHPHAHTKRQIPM
jgi:hypothetical protein